MDILITIVIAIGVAIEIWGLVIMLSAHGNLAEVERGSRLVAIGSTVVAVVFCTKVVIGWLM